MEQQLPDWMNKEFFEKCLQKEEGKSSIFVTNFTGFLAVPPGNNYGSYIIRVKVDYKIHEDNPELHSTSLIVKSELTDGPIKDLASQFALNEPSFYYKFIPKANKFSNISFAPKSFFSPKPDVTILEDLKEKGFIMADRTKQLDFDHCRLYMIAASSFHAVSVAVYKEHPELLEPINKELMYSNEAKTRDLFQLMVNGGMKWFANAIEKVERFKKYAKLLRDIKPHLWDMLVEAHKPTEAVKTIRQGDPWVTNMMFKYHEGKVCEIRIIDFQGTAYGSPVNDLMMFLWSSADNDVKKHKLDELFNIYLENFNGNLKKLNCPERLTYQELKANVEKLSPLALFIAASFLPCLVDPDPMDMNLLISKEGESNGQEDKFYEKYYTEDYCANFLPKVLECLEVNQVFDNMVKYRN